MSNASNRHPDDIYTREKANVTVSVISRGTGTYNVRGKELNFLSDIYRAYFPIQLLGTNDTDKGKKIFVTYNLHPDCSNGC